MKRWARPCLLGALRGAILCGCLGFFGPFLLWQLLHSAAVDPDSLYAWFREIGLQDGPRPPIVNGPLGLGATLLGALLGGLQGLADRTE